MALPRSSIRKTRRSQRRARRQSRPKTGFLSSVKTALGKNQLASASQSGAFNRTLNTQGQLVEPTGELVAPSTISQGGRIGRQERRVATISPSSTGLNSQNSSVLSVGQFNTDNEPAPTRTLNNRTSRIVNNRTSASYGGPIGEIPPAQQPSGMGVEPTPYKSAFGGDSVATSTASRYGNTGIGGIPATGTQSTGGGQLVVPTGGNVIGQEDFNFELTPEERALQRARERAAKEAERESQQNVSLEDSIREAQRRFQAEIDATNAVYADRISAANVAGQNRLGMQRAEDFNAGAVNSSFGNAARDRTIAFNEQAVQAIQNEKLLALSAIENEARNLGKSFYDEKKAAKAAGLEAFVTNLETAAAAKDDIANQIAESIFTSNLTVDEISQSKLTQIAKEAGVTVAKIKSQFNAIQKANTEEKEGFSLGKDQSRFEYNPQTGRYEQVAQGVISETGLPDTGTKSGLDLAAATVASGIATKNQREAFESTYQQLINAGREEDAKEFVRNTAIQNLPATQQDDIKTRDVIIDGLDALMETVMALEDAGVDTGIFKGKVREVKLKLGKLADNNPSLITFATQAQNILDLLSRDRTGAAMTPSEEEFYGRLFPSGGNKFELNIALIDALKGEMNREQDTRLGYIFDSGTQNTLYVGNQNNVIPEGYSSAGNIDGINYYQGPDGLFYTESEIPSFNQASSNLSLDEAVNKIASVESGGNYQALGPVLNSGQYRGQRAVGKYQVMEGNIGPWTQEAIGRAVSPEEFYNSPEIQDAVIRDRFQKLFQQYGNWDDVASVWFSGRPLAQAGNARDQLGTTVGQYVNKFNLA